jgi:hypothetical protein
VPNDPHRDALAAALARVEALERENRELRDGSSASPMATPLDEADRMIDVTLQQLHERLDTAADAATAGATPTATATATTRASSPAASPTKLAGRTPPCGACGSPRTLETSVKGRAAKLTVGRTALHVGRARACADCGAVVFLLDAEGRDWLSENFLKSLLAIDPRR